MGNLKVSSEDKQFLSWVSEAAFVNPFSEQRAQIDQQILGTRKRVIGPDMVPALIERVHQRLCDLDQDAGRLVALQDFEGEDRELMEGVVLFDVFHTHREDLDAFIVQQISCPKETLEVPFASEVLRALRSRGFTREKALRYFALFYQIRRAFYFIEQGLIGQCSSMCRLREDLWNTIFTHNIRWYDEVLWDRMEDFSILLLGPTGSGKGAAAAAIGRSGFIPFDERTGSFAESFTESFVSVNLTQYVETLLESELFGHTKGAFTGAVAGHEGLLSLCGRHGTIFLDEIGDINSVIQIKLLKVLEERTFYSVGSHQEKRFHGRVVAATHRSLSTLREQGTFRDDFYYRLCSDCIEVPGLHQRIQEDSHELDLMVAHAVTRITGSEKPELCQTVIKVIQEHLGSAYAWPGNVRELAQCVRRVIIKCDYQGEACQVAEGPSDQLAEGMRNGGFTAEQLLAQYCGLLYRRLGTFEEVARRTDLDRRTVKRYIQLSEEGG